jgi:hypothetical protein
MNDLESQEDPSQDDETVSTLNLPRTDNPLTFNHGGSPAFNYQNFTSNDSKAIWGQSPLKTNTNNQKGLFSQNGSTNDNSKSILPFFLEEKGQQEQEQSTGSDRKRNRRALYDDNALDDIMGQSKDPFSLFFIHLIFVPLIFSLVTNKLNTLTTGIDGNQQHSINAFIEVLNCTYNEANFYLESSAWDIQTAVILWLENNPSSWSRTGTFASAVQFKYQPIAPKYQPRIVHIEGLDVSEWVAKVDAYDGGIYFHNQFTGRTQRHVPPGFADVEDMSGQQLLLGGEEEEDDNDMITNTDNNDNDGSSSYQDNNSKNHNNNIKNDHLSALLGVDPGEDMMMNSNHESRGGGGPNELGEGWQSMPIGSVGPVSSHIFGTHSEYWKNLVTPRDSSLNNNNNNSNENERNGVFQEEEKEGQEEDLEL